MLRTLLHKTLLTAIAILLGGWAVVAQHSVVKGTALSFRAEENPSIDYRWEIYNVDNGITVNLASNTHITEEYTFDIAGNYQIIVSPIDKATRCLGEAAEVYSLEVVEEAPRLVFEDLTQSYACAATAGLNPKADIACSVTYDGPLPWKFKYSVDRNPAELAEGSDEIWTSTLDFVVTVPNKTGGLLTSEIRIVEAQSFSGLKIPEDPLLHMKKIKILPLPDTRFIDFEAIAMAGGIQNFSANIQRHDPDITPDSPDSDKRYEIFVPDGATVLNERTSEIDRFHSELSFQIQWGDELGDKEVKLLEKTNRNCYGDTIYATVNIIESFYVDLGEDKEVCKGTPVELKPFIDFEGRFEYKWSNGQDTKSITVTEAGTYTLTVTELDQQKTSVASVKVSHLETPLVDLGEDYELADGEVITLDAGFGATYEWSTGSENQTIKVDASGLYSVRVTGANGCQAEDEIKVTSVNDIFTIELGDDIVACVNDEVILNAKPEKAGKYSYIWSTGEESETIRVTESNTYSVDVFDEQHNKKSDTVDVLFNPLPIVDLGPNQEIFEDEIITLEGGVGESYLWSTDAKTQTIEVNKGGAYWLKITDNNNCVGRDDIDIEQKDGTRLIVDLGDDFEICEGDQTYLSPKVNKDIDRLKFNWIPSGSQEAGIFVDKTGKYCVEVSDELQNKETACVDVKMIPVPEVDLGDDFMLGIGETAELDAGNEGLYYAWSINGKLSETETSSTLKVNTSGKYAVQVMGINTCIGRDEVYVLAEGIRYIPSGFSPNGDGKNDVLYVQGADIKDVTFVIYNRGGQKIFQSNRKDIGWDGTYKGELQRMDTYIYFVKITLFDTFGGSEEDRTIIQRGEVTLLN